MDYRIGVLTSGGDSPGMNAAIRAIIRSGLKHNQEMFVIYNGFKGLVEGQIEQVDRTFVSSVINLGGTILRSARLPEFADVKVREKALLQLKKHAINALVLIGGDGTYRGAQKLSEMGINCIGLPGTIDNDIASTDYTIGFDTCLNTIIEAVDKLRDTTSSHQRCSIIEVMGNRSGDIALYSGIACGAELIVSSDHLIPRQEIMDAMKEQKRGAKQHAMIIVSEKLFDIDQLAKEIEREVGFETRTEVLGRLQRGGKPSAFDRVLASRMGAYAIECILADKSSRCIGIKGSDIVDYDINEALQMQRDPHQHLLKVIDNLK
jgi:6-phosphofructokinase 1